MNIVVIGNGGPNKGAAAITASTLNMLSRIFPEARITLLTEYPKTDSNQFGVETFKSLIGRQRGVIDKSREAMSLCFIILYGLLKLRGLNFPFFVEDKEKWQSLQACERADIVIFPSADTISSVYDVFTVIGALTHIFSVLALKRPIAILSAQIGPFGDSLKEKGIAFLSRLLLNRVDLITVRDKFSFDTLRKMGVCHPTIQLVADIAFLLPPAPDKRVSFILRKENIHPQKPLIGINTSALIWRYGFSSSRTAKEKIDKYIEFMSRIVDLLVDKLGATVVLLPHVFEADRCNDDREIARKIYETVRNKQKCKLITGEYSPQELKGIIGLFDLFISTRMHPLIHAISMGVPTIAIDYNIKQIELMKMVGQNDQVISVRSLNEPGALEQMASKIWKTFNDRKRISIELATRANMLESRALINERMLHDLLEKQRRC